jgi:hypothetical protein
MMLSGTVDPGLLGATASLGGFGEAGGQPEEGP